MKLFLEKLSQDAALAEKAEKETRIPALIALAAELGISLTEEDFRRSEELSDDELDAVAGGSDSSCGCIIGGAGRVGPNKTTEKLCVCVAGGGGEYANGECRCACVGFGVGYEGD